MSAKLYVPQPIDTGLIELPHELLELTELLSRNIHEVWAKQRIADGWKYGEKRDDTRKEHPGIVPYEELSETEKTYDRNTAMETLKVITKLGFEIKS
ncbi:MAG: Ryanodine receptor Ryr [Dysgonamonadaceae bacterium]|jgi:hypothetical protein|nr:Ryanodine receptor Ryr [Dysgonamonadaceae bacterium]